MPAPESVQGVERLYTEIVTGVLLCFYTEFSTVVLKNRLAELFTGRLRQRNWISPKLSSALPLAKRLAQRATLGGALEPGESKI